jgi:hypothetical protein
MEVRMNSWIDAADGHARGLAGSCCWIAAALRGKPPGRPPVVDNLSYATFYGGGSAEWSPGNPTYERIKGV